jgi:hypothetical protein
MMMTSTPTFMPSIRGPRASGSPRTSVSPAKPPVLRIVVITLLALGSAGGLLALVFWPSSPSTSSAAGATTPEERPEARPGALPRPSTSKPPRPSPPTILGAAQPPEDDGDGAPAPARPPSSRPSPARFSLRQEARKEAARAQTPPPGMVLCTLPPNHIIALASNLSITTDVGRFDTYYNGYRACGRPVELAIERSPAGLVVNGLSYDRRPACFDTFPATVIEVEDTPDRFYAAWILPLGGEIIACPDSQLISTRSRAERTPRQRSLPSPSTGASSTPSAIPAPSTATSGRSFGAWSAQPGRP